MPAVSHVAGVSNTNASGTTIAVTLPATVQDGDVAVAWIGTNAASGTTSGPAGWKKILSSIWATDKPYDCYVKELTAAEAGTVATWTTSSASNKNLNVAVFRDAVLPWKAFSSFTTLTRTNASQHGENEGMVVGLWADIGADPAFSTPSGWGTAAPLTVTGTYGSVMYYKALTAIGATPTATPGGGASDGNLFTGTIALEPKVTGMPQLRTVKESATNHATTAQPSLSDTMPTDIQDGDLVILIAAGSQTNSLNLSGPSMTKYDEDNYNGTLAVWYRYKTAGDGLAGQTWTVSQTSGNGNFNVTVLVFKTGTVHPTIPFDAFAEAHATSSVTSFSSPSVTPGRINTRVLFVVRKESNGADSMTHPSDTYEIADYWSRAASNYALLAVSQRPHTPGNTATGAKSWAESDNAANSSWITMTLALASTNAAPSAPTLLTPANASVAGLAGGYTFDWTFNDIDALDTQGGFQFRRKISGAPAYEYFNVSTGAWQSTPITNTRTQSDYTFASGLWTSGQVYNWSVATTDNGNALGPFASDFTVTAGNPATVSVLAPSGTVTEASQPTVSWSYSDPESDPQQTYQVKVESGAYGTTPGSGTTTWDSGEISSAATSVQIGTDLTNNTTFRAFVRAKSAGQYSSWAYTTFTMNLTPPSAPTLDVTPDPDNARNALVVTPTHSEVDFPVTSAAIEYSDDNGASWQQVRDAVAVAYGKVSDRAIAAWKANEYDKSGTLADLSGNGHDAVLGAGVNAPTFLEYVDSQYVYLPGVVGNFVSTPDNPALDITGDIDLRVKVAMDDWTPGASSALMSKYAAEQRSWIMQVVTDGRLHTAWSLDGSSANAFAVYSTVATGFADGSVHWVRVTRNATTGDITFYTSEDGVTWTQLGAVVSATAGSLFASTTPVEIGSWGAGVSGPLAGKVYRAIVKDGIDGTTVYDEDFTDTSRWTPAATSSPWKSIGIPAARTTFTRATTAYLDGVEVASGVLRYPYGRNQLDTLHSGFEAGSMTGTTASVSNGVLSLGGSLSGTNYAYANNFTRYESLFKIPTENKPFTFSAKIRAVDGGSIPLSGSPRIQARWAGQSAELDAVGSPDADGWQLVKYVGNVNASNAGSQNHYGFLISGGIARVFEIKEWQVEWGATATAFRPGGPSAVLIEEGTTNLLTANQSSIETDITGWNVYGTGDRRTRSTTRAWTGVASIRVAPLAGDTGYIGVTSATRPAVTAGLSYTVSAYIYREAGTGPIGVTLEWFDTGGATLGSTAVTTLSDTVLGRWSRLVATATAPANAASVKVTIYYTTPYVGGTDVMYIDGIQVEQKSYPTSWQLGGTTRNDDVLHIPLSVIPAPTSAGTIELEYTTGIWALNTSGDAANDLTLGNPGSHGFLMRRMPTGELQLQYYGSSTVNLSTAATDFFVAGRRISVAITWDSAGVSLYVDGVLVAGNVPTWNAPTGPLNVGARDADQGNSTFDQIRISNVKKDAAQIAAAVGTPWTPDANTVWFQDFRSTLAGEYGQVSTINRPASGKKLAVVDRDLFLFGTDDYMEVADHADLDFSLTDSFTVVLLFRRYGIPTSTQAYLAKRNLDIYDPGYAFFQSNAENAPRLQVSDTAAADTAYTPTLIPGALSVIAGVRNRTMDQITSYLNGVAGTPTTDPLMGTMTGSHPLRIGRTPAGTTYYADMEFMGAAIFREALTADDLAALSTEFLQGVGLAVTVYDYEAIGTRLYRAKTLAEV